MKQCKIKNKILALCAILLFSYSSYGQLRAPSCWLKYQDRFEGDIITNTLKVSAPSPLYTYYCALQWNAGAEGGGYCGMQEHPDGRNFIYSIWDPINSNDAITADYTHPGTRIENFGGEGTGLKSWNFEIGWEVDNWYSFTTRNWNENNHSFFGFWIYDHTNLKWHHLVTMNFPVSTIRFSSPTGSFIEDWLGNGHKAREVSHKNGWKRKISDFSWQPFTNPLFEREVV